MKAKFGLAILVLLSLVFMASDFAFGGTVTGQVVAPNGVPIKSGVLTWQLSQMAYQSGSYAVAAMSAQCATDSVTGNVIGMGDPLTTNAAPGAVGGDSLAANTYYVRFAWVDSVGGITNASPEATVTLSGTGRIVITVTNPVRAVSVNIYVGLTPGSETLQKTSAVASGPGTVFLNTSLVSGAALPSTNTTACSLIFNDALIPSYTSYKLSIVSNTGSSVPGFPQSYYLAGPIVSFAAMTPAGNLKVTWPSAILATPSGGATQSVSGYLSALGFLANGVAMPTTGTANTWLLNQQFASYNHIVMADAQTGSDACAKIVAAVALLPSTGGTVDARGFQGAQTCASDPYSGVGSKVLTLIFGPTTISSSATWNIPSNSALLANGTVLKFGGVSAGFNAVGATNFKIVGLKIDTTLTTSVYAIKTDAATSGVMLDNISVLGAATNALANGEVYLQGADISVRHSTFDTVTFVLCFQCNGGDMEDNSFSNVRTGIYLLDTTGTSDRNFSIRGNRFLSAAGALLNGLDSILVESSRNVTVAQNVTKAANEHCIYVSNGFSGSSNIEITGNTCAGWSGGAGIQVRGSFSGTGNFNSNITVTGNTAIGTNIAGTFGFLFIGNRGLTVSGNIASRNGLDGFYFDNIYGGNVSSNLSNANGTAGFRIADDQNIGPVNGLTFTGNTAVNNNLNGNGFTAFHIAMTHGFAHKQIHFIGNYAANDLPVAAVTTIVRTSNVVTVTSAVPHFITSGIYSRLIIAGVADATFNTTINAVAVTVVDATHFTYPQAVADATSSGGTIEPKAVVNGYSSSMTGGSTLDLLTYNDNNTVNMVGSAYSGTLTATLCTISDMSSGAFAIRSCPTGPLVASIDGTGKATFNGGVAFPGSSSGTITVTATPVAGASALLLPAATGTFGVVIASGTSALGTGAITTGTCAAVVTTAATNALATDTISWAFNAAPSTGYTGGVHVLPYVTAGNVNFLVCNPTVGSLTPAAATLNWRVVR